MKNANNKNYYYIYSQGVLGVKTNIKNFKWIYGSAAPEGTFEEYEECIVKFNINEKEENILQNDFREDKIFQSYSWDEKTNTLFYRRKFFSFLKIGYNITFKNDVIDVCIGKKYNRLIKKRVMNLHGIYFLLSDIANIILLSKGYLTLYASAVHDTIRNKSYVCFAPPNTGKTITALKLCDIPECCMVGEDIILTDGRKLYSCPWTCSYRKGTNSFDSAGSFGRTNKVSLENICLKCDLTNLIVLSKGKESMSTDKAEVLRQINILNAYLFNHYASPIVKILGFFDKNYCKNWNELAGELLNNIVNDNECHEIHAENALDFYKIIYCRIIGEKS